MFSVALSVRTPHGVASRVYPTTGYAASRPLVFGLSSSPDDSEEAILRPSKIRRRIRETSGKASGTELKIPSSRERLSVECGPGET
jgi:hypothetical protein